MSSSYFITVWVEIKPTSLDYRIEKQQQQQQHWFSVSYILRKWFFPPWKLSDSSTLQRRWNSFVSESVVTCAVLITY